MKLGYTLDYKLGYIYVDYDLEFLSGNTCISNPKWELLTKFWENKK